MKYTVDSSSFDYWLALSVVVVTETGVRFSSQCRGSMLVIWAKGVYIVLFILAVYTLARRKSAGKKLLLGYTWAMAVLGTMQLVLCLVQLWIGPRFVEVFVKQDATSQSELVLLARSLDTAQTIIFAGNNLVTDSLLLYRCFVIWGSNWRPVVFPGILIACTFLIGCVASFGFSGLIIVPAPLFHLQYVFAAFTNLVLVVLIGGRVWYIRQDARVVAGNELRKRYDTVIAMVLESGAMYFVVLVLLAIFASESSAFAFDILESIAIHIVNIIPTLIIVRVGLGQNIQDTGKTPLAKEARDTRPQPRADFSAHRTRSPLLPVLYIKASEDTLIA